MRRRQVLAALGLGTASTLSGCGSLGVPDGKSTKTVDPALDGTPTADSGTPAAVGDWRVELDRTEAHTGVYGDRLVVAERLADGTRVRGFDTASGERVYDREIDTRHGLPHRWLAREENGNAVLPLDGPEVRLLDPATGETRWHLDTAASTFPREFTQQYVLVGEDGWDRVIALDTETWTEDSVIDITTDSLGFGEGYVLREATEAERTDGTETPPVGTGVACHDTQTGELSWTATLPVELADANAVRAGDSLLFASEQMVACYDFETGDRRYTAETDVPLGLPWADDDERVYFGNYNGGEIGRVVAFGDDGEVWRREFGGEAAYPTFRGDRFHVIVRSSDGSRVVRVDRATGDVRWRQRGDFHGPAGDGDIYVRRGSRVARIDDEGRVVWQASTGVTRGDRPRFWRQYGDAFLAWTGDELVALDAATGDERERVTGFDSLDGLVPQSESATPRDRAFLDFGGRIEIVSV